MLQAVHANGLETEVQHHLHGARPLGIHVELLGKPRLLGETGLAQPLHDHPRALAERVLLQRLQRRESSAEALLTFARLVQGVRRCPLHVAGAVELLLAGSDGALELYQVALGALDLGALLVGAALERLGGQTGLLAAQPIAALLELRHGLHQVLDTRGLGIAHACRLRSLLAPRLPVRLPGVHGLLAGAKPDTRLGGIGVQPLELRLEPPELAAQLARARRLRLQVHARALQALLLGGQVLPLLLALAAQVLDGLLAARNGGLGVEHAPVDLVERLGNGTLVRARLLELRLDAPLLREAGL